MGSRSHYLPRNLDKLSDHDRAVILEYHQRILEEEIAGLESGYIVATHRGKAYQLNLSRARMRRLVKTANDYGLWLDDDQQAA